MRPLIGDGLEQGDGAKTGDGKASVPGHDGPIDVRRHHGTQAMSFSNHASGEGLIPVVPSAQGARRGRGDRRRHLAPGAPATPRHRPDCIRGLGFVKMPAAFSVR
jgi:hypothetical protein